MQVSKRIIILALIATFLSVPVTSKTYYYAIGWSKPPYVIKETKSGFEIELMQMIFKQLELKAEPVFVPFGRTAAFVSNDEVDIGMTMNSRHKINPEWLSDVYVGYQNVAISITDNGFQLDKISDLASYSVVSFQSASILLGEDYKKAVSDHRNYIELPPKDRVKPLTSKRNGKNVAVIDEYIELPDQSQQVAMLLRRHIDVAVMDVNIFHYFKSTLAQKYSQIATTTHPIFPSSPYQAAIKDASLRKKFNHVLAEMIDDGRYQALLEKFGLIDVLGLTSN